MGLLLFAYSSLYYYETPTYPGIASLYSNETWYSQSLIPYSGYKYSISFVGIVPYSLSSVKHASMDFYKRFGNIYAYSGIKHRDLSSIYTENTFILGSAYRYRFVSMAMNLRLINLHLTGENPLTKPSMDISLGLKKSRFIAAFSLFNLLRPDLSISQSNIKSYTGERLLLSLNFPDNVYFTAGYEKDQDYETPFMSTEVWFTHGFNIAFGIENHTVEGAIGLRSERFGFNMRIKSHTTMGATYIAGLSFYRE